VSWAKEEIKRTPGAREDVPTLRATLSEILPLIRFPIMTATEMALTVTPSKLLTSEQELQLYTHIGSQAGKKKVVIVDEKKGAIPKIAGFPARLRRPPGTLLAATARFEDNSGIVYWIGTNEAKGTYTNPATSGGINITMSSTGGSASTALFDRNYTGSAVENSYGREPQPWIMCEFRRYRIRPTAYFLAQEQDHYVRNWRMEGSDDGATFTVIREHTNDATLHTSNRWAFFDLKSPAFFRFIRLILTGPGHNGSANFDITEMEFYGYVVPAE